ERKVVHPARILRVCLVLASFTELLRQRLELRDGFRIAVSAHARDRDLERPDGLGLLTTTPARTEVLLENAGRVTVRNFAVDDLLHAFERLPADGVIAPLPPRLRPRNPGCDRHLDLACSALRAPQSFISFVGRDSCR